jgi:hypothetical protein
LLFPWSSHRVQTAAHRAGPASVHTTEDAVAWSAGLAGQDADARVVSVRDLADLVTPGRGTGWAEAAGTAQRVAIAHREAADLLDSVLARLDSAWRGGAAGAARATTRRFRRIVDTTEATFAGNCLNVAEADHGFQRLKAALAQLGPRPEQNLYDVLSPWRTDTEKAITAYNEKAARYLEHYHAYATQLDGQARELRSDYGGFTDEPGARAAPASPAGSGPRRATGTVPLGPAATGSAATAPGAVVTPGAAEPRADAPAGAFAVDPAAAGSVTTTAGYAATGTPVPPERATGGPGFAAPPPGSAAATPSPGFGGAFRGSLPGGPAGAPRGGPGTPREEVRGGRSPAVSGGRSPAVPGGHAPGGRSRRERDQEHERKYVLDDGSLFTDDERHARVDPATGMTTVDPTIGA